MAHIADPCAIGAKLGTAKNLDRASRGTCQSSDDPQQRSFTGAVFPQQDVEASSSQSGRKVMKRGEAPKQLAYALQDDCGLGVACL